MTVSSTLPRWACGLLELDAEVQEFAAFAEKCKHRITNSHGVALCNLHESAPGDCGPGLCSLWDKSRLDQTGVGKHARGSA